MTRLLLDAHLSPAIAARLTTEGFDVVALQAWNRGAYRHAGDDLILAAAAAEDRVWVTFDLRVQRLVREGRERKRISAENRPDFGVATGNPTLAANGATAGEVV